MSYAERIAAAFRSDDGAQMVEYGFLMLGVALVVFVAAETFGLSLSDLLRLPLAFL